jgi:hypothetical protein
MGLPVVRSGGFAITYELTGPSGAWAVRCFHKTTSGLDDLKRRYDAISGYLNSQRSRYFVSAEYQEDGIRVRQVHAPITKMAWSDGEPLNVYVEKHVRDRQRMIRLAPNFVALIEHLERNGVAHGDLQHGNILVSQGDFKLVDYDGMFVPSLKGLSSNELGHVNYQHPKRSASDFNDRIDRFSAIVIYIALTALIVKPDLWDEYGAGGENLLFQQSDFIDPNRSKLFADLNRIPSIDRMASHFAAICLGELDDVPALIPFSNGTLVAPVARKATASRQALVRRQYEVISSSDLDKLRLRIGQRIEVVGRVEEVYRSITRFQQPYAKLNFGPYGRSFSIPVWSGTLRLFERSSTNLSDLKGRWISVTGVVDDYNGLPQIEIESPIQLELFASRVDAKERLGSDQSPANSVTTTKRTLASATATVASSHATPNRAPSVKNQQKKAAQALDRLYKDFPVSSSPQSSSMPSRAVVNQNVQRKASSTTSVGGMNRVPSSAIPNARSTATKGQAISNPRNNSSQQRGDDQTTKNSPPAKSRRKSLLSRFLEWIG